MLIIKKDNFFPLKTVFTETKSCSLFKKWRPDFSQIKQKSKEKTNGTENQNKVNIGQIESRMPLMNFAIKAFVPEEK